MDRRNFLRRFVAGLAGTAALATIDVEQLLWMPGARTIFLPSELPEPIYLAGHLNTFITSEWLTREIVRHFKANLTLAAHVEREYARLPQRFGARGGKTDRLRTALNKNLRPSWEPT